MRLDAFLDALPSLYEDFPTDHARIRQRDRTFDVLTKIPSFTSESVVQLLALAVEHLEYDEIYCEVGSMNGGSVISAMIGRVGQPTRAVAVDNFSQFGGRIDVLQANLSAFSLRDQVRVIDEDARQVFTPGRDLDLGGPIGVLFYDGGHSYTETLSILVKAIPLLAPHALIVVDDYNWSDPQAATREFVRLGGERAHLHYELFTPGYTNMVRDSWWNGLALVGWRDPAYADDRTPEAEEKAKIMADLRTAFARVREPIEAEEGTHT